MAEINGLSALISEGFPLFLLCARPALRVRSDACDYASWPVLVCPRMSFLNRHGNSPRVLPESVNSQQ